ncbi:MAG: filamentous hemagglutinin N-terminal domain-containing protein, partial [Burkholderiales bacterium]
MKREHRSTRRNRSGLNRKLVALAVASCFVAEVAQANPTGGVVVIGNAVFSQNGTLLSITNSPGTVINWQSFSISANEITKFIQQSGSSAVFNRVTGGDISVILGALQSNGRVFLINGNGIVIGPGANINVNGFLASTLDMSNQDFLAGKFKFQDNPNAGALINNGTITTPAGGHVYLVAPNVTNNGIINSPNGEVLLAAGRSVEIFNAMTPEVRVEVVAPANEVVNLGQIMASGGRIGMHGGVVRQAGLVSADSAVMGENGKIVFKATQDVILAQGSVTTASGTASGAGGGSVSIEGATVTNNGTVRANAGDNATAGNVSMIAQDTLLLSGTSLVEARGADVLSNGGSVYLYSSGNAYAQNGQVIDFSGGLTSGNGGSGEFSAGNLASFAGSVIGNAAPGYTRGSFIIDPLNATVSGVFAANTTIWAEDNIDINGNVTVNSGVTLTLLADHDSATPGTWDDGTGGALGMGSITRSGAFTITGADSTTGLVMWAAGGGIGSSGTPILTAMNGGSVTVNTSNAAQVGTADTFISNTGALNIAGLNASANSNNFQITSSGAVTQTGAITTAGGLELLGAGTFTLTNAGNDVGVLAGNTTGDVSYTNGTALSIGTVGASVGLTTTGNVVLQSSGPLTQTALIDVNGTSSFTAGANAITLTNGSNDFTGAVSLNNSGANNVAVTDANALVLGTSSVGTGTLTVNAVGITQTGALTQAGGAGAATFNGGAGVITLTQANDFTGAVSLNNSGANNVAVTDANALVLGTSSVGTGTLTVNAVG